MNQGGTSTLILRNKTNCQGYSRSEYQAGMFDGEGATSMKQYSIYKCAPDLTVRP